MKSPDAHDIIDQSKQVKPKRKRGKKSRPVNSMLVKQFREFTLASGVVFKGLSSRKEPLTGDG